MSSRAAANLWTSVGTGLQGFGQAVVQQNELRRAKERQDMLDARQQAQWQQTHELTVRGQEQQVELAKTRENNEMLRSGFVNVPVTDANNVNLTPVTQNAGFGNAVVQANRPDIRNPGTWKFSPDADPTSVRNKIQNEFLANQATLGHTRAMEIMREQLAAQERIAAGNNATTLQAARIGRTPIPKDPVDTVRQQAGGAANYWASQGATPQHILQRLSQQYPQIPPGERMGIAQGAVQGQTAFQSEIGVAEQTAGARVTAAEAQAARAAKPTAAEADMELYQRLGLRQPGGAGSPTVAPAATPTVVQPTAPRTDTVRQNLNLDPREPLPPDEYATMVARFGIAEVNKRWRKQ